MVHALPSESIRWNTTATSYASNVGKTSAFAAARTLQLANELAPINHNSKIIDVGAGTGAVTLAAASSTAEPQVLATDIAASMLANIDGFKLPNVETRVVDALELSKEPEAGTLTHAFSTFVLQTITTPLDVLHEMNKTLAPGGVIGIGCWAQANGPFDIFEAAAQKIDPTWKLPAPFEDKHAWRTVPELEENLTKAGFKDLKLEEVTMPFEFPSTQAFLDFWFGAKNPAALNVMAAYHGDLEPVKVEMEKITREEYRDGHGIETWAVVGVGRK